MPELPEVESFKYILAHHALHKKIKKVAIKDTRLIKGISASSFEKNLVGHNFASVDRIGKMLVVTIKDSDVTLIMHFGLTGFLVFSKTEQEKVKFSQVDFLFADSSVLHWLTVRKFAKLWLLKKAHALKHIAQVGVDALKITKKQLELLVEKYPRKNVKAFLMDQSLIAGIGNEYSDEILFQAGIDPHHVLKALSRAQITKMYTQIKKVLKYAIAVRIDGIKKHARYGSSADFHQMFKNSYLQSHRHIDMICPKNKNHTLKKATIAGRTSYYCPHDQK